MVWRQIRHLIIGPPLPTQEAAHARLDNFRALAALSPDALASVAYANQEIFLGLVVAGAVGLAYSTMIALVITGILALLALSYSQTIRVYTRGGGSYQVARENLGTLFGLVAAGGLLTAYVLNAAVSLTAGVAAMASAFPALWEHRTGLALALLVVITLVNLRGPREACTFLLIPVYLFLATYLGMIAYGVVIALIQGPGSLAAAAPPPVEGISIFLVLHTFASGCTALTGVEAISNAVPVFRPPESRHANQTMAAMAILMAVLFLGTVGATEYLAVVAGPEETILSALARRLFGSGAIYLLVQAATLLVLIVAANTSFVGFPRVTSIMAQDSFLPRQLSFLGDRLVFSNGILVLAGLAGLLITSLGGDTHALIPLFAVGSFVAFTLSQAGMVAHWIKERGPHWGVKAFFNGLGAAATALALVVIGASNFVRGAWIVIVLIPVMVLIFCRVYGHYQEVRKQLTLRGLPPTLKPMAPPRIVLPISGVHRGVIEAVRYARSISDDVTAIYVELAPGAADRVRDEWKGLEADIPLVVVSSPYRSLIGPFLDSLNRLDLERHDGQLASVLIPEFVPARWWHHLLHNQTAWLLKLVLTYRRYRQSKSRAIIDLPFHLRH